MLRTFIYLPIKYFVYIYFHMHMIDTVSKTEKKNASPQGASVLAEETFKKPLFRKLFNLV